MVAAVVREWHEALGWGVLDSPHTPGGCWTHFSNIESPPLRRGAGFEMSAYKTLNVGEAVELEYESPGQDGFDFRAAVVRRRT